MDAEHRPSPGPGYILIIRMTITTKNGRKIRRPDGRPWAFWVKEKK